MQEKLLLIDGHSILNRAYYGLPPMTNSEGLHTNAVYGFLNILFKIMEEEKPDYLTVAFDLSAPTFRHKMYAEYKGTRKGMDPELREQVPVMKEMLQAMGVVIVQKEGYEADDLLGTIGRMGEEKGLLVSTVSGDRDLLQLATKKVQIRIPKTKRTGTEIENYFEDDVKEKYQVTPKEFIDLKALMGDTSDNIPGVPGIGEKTATALIIKYGSIENAYAHVEEITPNRAKTNLQEHYDMAEMSKVLATIDTHADITYDFEEARVKNLFTPEAYALCQKLQLKNMLKKFDGVVAEQVQEEPLSFSVETDLTQAESLWEAYGKAPFGFWCMQEAGTFYGVAVSDGEQAHFFPVEGFLTQDYLCGKLQAALQQQVGATLGLKAQLPYIQEEDAKKFFDGEIAAYLLNPLIGHYAYDEIAQLYLSKSFPDGPTLIGKKGLAAAEAEKRVEYACYHALVAAKTRGILEEALKERGMDRLFYELEMPLTFVLASMEKEGIIMDADLLASYSEMLGKHMEELENRIYAAAGESFNINSPKQLGEILFVKMAIPNKKKTKTGFSTAADVLEKLAPDYPIISDILEYRTYSKLKSTYADGLPAFLAEDGRVHSTFQQTVTATGRLSSTDPNLQNIPMKTDLGRQIRKAFLPKEGFVFVDADYSQIELRVMAHMSGDENLIAAYKSAQDIHRMTASQVFHVPFDEVTPLQRRNAKAVNFGIIYGISSFGLSQDLSISTKEAKAYIDRYFEVYPDMHAFIQGLVEQAKETGEVTTMYGRIRPIPELSSSNFMQRSFGERVAMNSPIQGTAADIIKIAMLHVYERLKKEGLESKLILQVHDELLIEAKESEVEQVTLILKEEMEQAARLSVPLEVDMHQGSDWYEAK